MGNQKFECQLSINKQDTVSLQFFFYESSEYVDRRKIERKKKLKL